MNLAVGIRMVRRDDASPCAHTNDGRDAGMQIVIIRLHRYVKGKSERGHRLPTNSSSEITANSPFSELDLCFSTLKSIFGGTYDSRANSYGGDAEQVGEDES